MKLKFSNTPEQVELVKAMGSKDTLKSMQAQETFAALLEPLIGEQYLVADETGMIFRDIPYAEDSDPSLPLDLFVDQVEGLFTITSQTMAGGLPSNSVSNPVQELKFNTYRLDSQISYLKKWAAKSRLDVVAKSIERLLQEILLKAKDNAWVTAFYGAPATSFPQIGGRSNMPTTTTNGTLNLQDINFLFTYFRRLGASWSGGTPVGGSQTPTDMFLSPEQMQRIRSFAYNPVNTLGANNVAGTQYSGVITAPDEYRKAVFEAAGTPEFFGVNLIELLELGISQRYTNLFSGILSAAGNPALPSVDLTSASTETFAAGTNDLIIAIDAKKDFAWRPIATDTDTGSVFELLPDNQFLIRSEKIGTYGAVEEGRVITDYRPLVFLSV